MRKSKLVLPIISFLLSVILAVLLILPVNVYAIKEEPGQAVFIYEYLYCFCGSGNSCLCVSPEEEPTE
jgi:hypothetical protein